MDVTTRPARFIPPEELTHLRRYTMEVSRSNATHPASRLTVAVLLASNHESEWVDRDVGPLAAHHSR